MMLGHITLRLFIIAEQREVQHPSKLVLVVVDQAKLTSDFQAERAKHVGNHFLLSAENSASRRLRLLCVPLPLQFPAR